MIAHKLERFVAEYIATRYREAGHSVVGSGGKFDVTFTGTGIAGQRIRILAGETLEEQTAPKIIVSCPQTSEDFDTGNHLCDVAVAITYPVDGDGTVRDQFARLTAETDRLSEFLVDDNLPGVIHETVTADRGVTVIGVAGRDYRTDYNGHTRTHEISLRLYVAGVLIPQE